MCWIERTLSDASLPGKVPPFELFFGRKPRTTLNTVEPHVDDAELNTGLESGRTVLFKDMS